MQSCGLYCISGWVLLVGICNKERILMRCKRDSEAYLRASFVLLSPSPAPGTPCFMRSRYSGITSPSCGRNAIRKKRARDYSGAPFARLVLKGAVSPFGDPTLITVNSRRRQDWSNSRNFYIWNTLILDSIANELRKYQQKLQHDNRMKKTHRRFSYDITGR
jgi:hypothetical protein